MTKTYSKVITLPSCMWRRQCFRTKSVWMVSGSRLAQQTNMVSLPLEKMCSTAMAETKKVINRRIITKSWEVNATEEKVRCTYQDQRMSSMFTCYSFVTMGEYRPHCNTVPCFSAYWGSNQLHPFWMGIWNPIVSWESENNNLNR